MGTLKKIAIVTTHPIQYQSPWFRLMVEKGFQIKVFYTWEQSGKGKIFDPGFGKEIKWDIPLLEGYEYEFVKNSSPIPGITRFLGLINPGLIPSIEAWKADCLFVNGWNYYSHLNCMRYFHHKIPVFFRGDSVLLFEKKGIKQLARRSFLKWVYRHIDYAYYAGTHSKSYFLIHGLRPEQLIYSPHAIDLDRFAEPEEFYSEYASTFKNNMGVPSHHVTVLFAGKMTRNKNPEFIVKLAEACKNLPVSFVLVGDGSEKNRLRENSTGNKQIFYLGFQNQTFMPAIYRMGDIYILPSKTETWGIGVNEAMACGRPVMVSEKVGCGIDLVQDKNTGIIFRLGDIETCYQFLKDLSENRDKLKEMGANALQLIQSFTFSQIVDSISQTMEKINLKNAPAKNKDRMHTVLF